MANSHFSDHSDALQAQNKSQAESQAQAPHCIACQALLTDALDGNLGEIDQAWFDSHVRTCAECGPLFADAQRGAAWLDLLKSTPPEPAADLIDRILAQTTSVLNQQPAPTFAFPTPVPSFRPRPDRPTPVRQIAAWAHLPAALFEPRLAMTAAMALFSLALTMNLTGTEIGQLRPSNLRRTYYQSTAGVSRYYDNLRVVHVLESRVDDLREANADSEAQPSTTPTPQPTPTRPESAPQPASIPNNGVSRRDLPSHHSTTLYAQASSWKAGGLV